MVESTIDQLKPLKRNPNKGSKRTHDLLHTSFEQAGAGRSILLAANNEVLAGNHALETYGQVMDNPNIIVVETDGKALVAVRRTDIPNAEDKRAQHLIIADNKTSDHHEYDVEVLQSYDEDIVGDYWFDTEIALLEERQSIDYDAHWQGMPEFDNDKVAHRSIIVHFETEEAITAFAQLIDQSITEKTKYLYYPKQIKANLLARQVQDES